MRTAPYVERGPFEAALYRTLTTREPTRFLWFNNLFAVLLATATATLIWNKSTRAAGFVAAMTFAYFCVLTGLVEIENYRYRMTLEPTAIMAITLAAFVGLSATVRRRSANSDKFVEFRA